MSLTLGEKLRDAREERGISISEVAEQTRISPMYLELIENDDYRTLPGGIFNKGFVKSFAKYVGVGEQEALADYARIVSANEEIGEPELKVYRPEVLTDNNSGSSMVPTVIVAIIILAIMTAGILFLVDYLRRPASPTVANSSSAPAANSNSTTPTNAANDSSAPTMGSFSIEFKATSAPVKVTTTVDGEPVKSNNVSAGSSITFTPKESLTVNYSRWNFDKVQMTINGKSISLPNAPLTPTDRDRIIVSISKDNLAQIWSRGSITEEASQVTGDANANVATTAPTTNAPAQPRPTQTAPKPSAPANSAANTMKPAPANTAKPPTMSGKPPTMTGKPAANKPN